MNTRRQFLISAPIAALVVATSCRNDQPTTNSQTPTTAGAPPTFGTGNGTGPVVTPETFAEAEKLMQMTERDIKHDLTGLISKLQNEARDNAEEQAGLIIATAMERMASEVTAERTVTSVSCPGAIGWW